MRLPPNQKDAQQLIALHDPEPVVISKVSRKRGGALQYPWPRSGISRRLMVLQGSVCRDVDTAFLLPTGRGDEAKAGGSAPDSREPKQPIANPHNMYTPYLHIEMLKVKARNFR